MDDTLSSCLDLMRRLPPQNVEQNLNTLCDILPDLTDDLLSSVDQPLKVQVDAGGRQYLICDYNRDMDAYRSPWTNTYTPAIEDGTAPSPKLRTLEVAMNEAFDVYRDMYFEGGVSSVYLWDLGDGFAGVVLLKKVHVFETSERGRTAQYKLTSTVMLYMVKDLGAGENATAGSDQVTLGGSLTRQTELDAPHDPSSTASNISSHISNIGKFIEDQEGKMRNSLQEVYFSKTKDIVNSVRSAAGFGEAQKRSALQGELAGLLRGKAAATAS